MIALLYPDACPVCPPGDHDACLPVGIPEPVNGGMLADYQHGYCGTAWTTWFTQDGWPVERSIAPVSPEQAAGNCELLELALDEQARERRSAA
jgi:hypothetical protein